MPLNVFNFCYFPLFLVDCQSKEMLCVGRLEMRDGVARRCVQDHKGVRVSSTRHRGLAVVDFVDKV